MKETAEEMSIMEFLNLDACTVNKLHPVLTGLATHLDVRKATVQLLLLVKRYPLTTSHTAGTRKCAVCPMCQTEPETTVHFLLHCPVLQPYRIKFLIPILESCRENRIPVDPPAVIKAILDPTAVPKPEKTYLKLCRDFVFKLHSERSVNLGGESEYKRL